MLTLARVATIAKNINKVKKNKGQMLETEFSKHLITQLKYYKHLEIYTKTIEFGKLYFFC